VVQLLQGTRIMAVWMAGLAVAELSPALTVPGAVSCHVELSLSIVRTEVTYTTCGGRLHHVSKGDG